MDFLFKQCRCIDRNFQSAFIGASWQTDCCDVHEMSFSYVFFEGT